MLTSTATQIMLLCSRQVGKTQTAAALAVKVAVLEAPALVLVLSPSERQSGEFIRRVSEIYDVLKAPRNLARPVQTVHEKILAEAGKDDWYFTLPEKERESALQLHLENGSRIIGLPASEGKIRCYSSVALLIIDEASRAPDEIYRAMRPTMAVSQGRIVALSTPFGKRGWFYDEWIGEDPWQRVRVQADQCSRIPPEFLEKERRTMGERWYRQEYFCSFEDTVDTVFSPDDIAAALVDGIAPLALD